MTSETVSSELSKFIQQLNEHDVKINDILSTVLILKRDLHSIKHCRDNVNGKEYIESYMNEQKNKRDEELEELRNAVKESRDEIILLKMKHDKELKELKEVILQKNTELKQIQDEEKKKTNLLQYSNNCIQKTQDQLQNKINSYEQQFEQAKQLIKQDKTDVLEKIRILKEVLDDYKTSHCYLLQTIEDLKEKQMNSQEIIQDFKTEKKPFRDDVTSKVTQIKPENEFLKKQRTISDVLEKLLKIEERLLKVETISDDLNKKVQHSSDSQSSIGDSESHEFIHIKDQLLKEIQKENGAWIENIKLQIQNQQDFFKKEVSRIVNQLDVLYKNLYNSPLHYASENSQYSKAKFLLSFGATINLINSNGETPLHLAVKTDYKYLVELLVWYKADLNLKNRLDMTPLMIAVYLKKSTIEYLLSKGADPNITSAYGLTALHFAILNQDYPIIQTLLKYKVDVAAAFKGVISPIVLATISKNNEIINIIKTISSDFQNVYPFNPKKTAFYLVHMLMSSMKNDILSDFSFKVLKNLILYGNYKQAIGQSGIISILMNHLDSCLSLHNFSSKIETIWKVMVLLTDTMEQNCVILTNNNFMTIFIKCCNLFQQGNDCLPAMFDTLSNIAEVKKLRQEMISSTFISLLLELIDSQHNMKHQIIKVFGHIFSDDSDVWINNQPSRETVIKKIEDVICNLRTDLPMKLRYNVLDHYSSIEPIFELLAHKNYEVQLCGAWLLANIMNVAPDFHYTLIQKLDGFSKLVSISTKVDTNGKVKELLNSAIKNYIVMEKK